jgi:hypothetical protein
MQVRGQETDEMTHEEIETRAAKLREIVAKVKDQNHWPPGVREDMVRLALDVGAYPLHQYTTVDHLFLPELANRIHQALQTASMIDACRTAAKNVELAENAQAAASRAQQVAFWSMLAAWGAVVVNIVVAYIMAATR